MTFGTCETCGALTNVTCKCCGLCARDSNLPDRTAGRRRINRRRRENGLPPLREGGDS